MKKVKCALGMVAVLASALALGACDEATWDASGGVMTYTDAQGNVVKYTASDLLTSYQSSSSALSTEFDKVYEVLVRHYYDSLTDTSTLAALKKNATSAVLGDKTTATTNAKTNSTSYETEFEKILTTYNCDNVDDLFQYHLYVLEKAKFENQYYDNLLTNDSTVSGIAAMRDGSTSGLDGTNDVFPASTEYGVANAGWIKEQMPYFIRHILVKVSASAGAYTQGELTETTSTSEGGEATKLANVILQLAGSGKTTDTRSSFGEIALNMSDDSTSAANFGAIDLMTKVMSSDLVNEFKLGIYAYESLYNQREKATTYGSENVHRITPGLTEDATSTTDVDADQTLDDSGTTINEFFKNGETYDDGSEGIGQIPYGAAVALLNSAKTITDANGNNVYEANANFFPRNILFNKYFNKHNVCVITPNEIPYNDSSLAASEYGTDVVNGTTGTISKEPFDGVYSSTYGALPGFSTNTTDILPGFTHNVLTDKEGQVILAVRAGTSSYQGIHFIVVQRSALDKYGTASDTESADTANLSQYYTTTWPGQTNYPTTSAGDSMDTYVNYNLQLSSLQQTRAETVVSDIKSYNSNLSTYMFQKLIEDESVTFKDSTLEATMQNYVKTKRDTTVNDNFTTWTNAWKTYAEVLESQNEARSQGSATGTGTLLSEVCAIGYSTHTGAAWEQGGACYYVK
jgi:hypothetical protein